MINFENNSKEISRVYDLYQKATRKTGIEIVNRMAKNAAIKTISKMPILPAKEISKNNPKTFKGRRYPNRLHFARVSKKTPKGSGIRDAAEKSFNRAKSSRGFLKALFVNIAKDLGGTSKKSVVAGGSASKSKAALAKESKLFSSLKSGPINDDQHDIVKKSYNQALSAVLADMRNYANKKLSDVNRKHSG